MNAMEFVLCMLGLSRLDSTISCMGALFSYFFLFSSPIWKKEIHSFFLSFSSYFSCLFTEFGNTRIGTGCTSDPVIVRPAIILIDTMLRSETTDRSFNNEFESDIVSGYGALLCGHRSRQVVLFRSFSFFRLFHTSLWHPQKSICSFVCFPTCRMEICMGLCSCVCVCVECGF